MRVMPITVSTRLLEKIWVPVFKARTMPRTSFGPASSSGSPMVRRGISQAVKSSDALVR